jgi:hypothetical protein
MTLQHRGIEGQRTVDAASGKVQITQPRAGQLNTEAGPERRAKARVQMPREVTLRTRAGSRVHLGRGAEHGAKHVNHGLAVRATFLTERVEGMQRTNPLGRARVTESIKCPRVRLGEAHRRPTCA